MSDATLDLFVLFQVFDVTRKPLAEDLGLRTLTSNGLLTKQQVWIWYVCFLEGNVFKLKLLAPVRIFRLNLKLIDLFTDLLVC